MTRRGLGAVAVCLCGVLIGTWASERAARQSEDVQARARAAPRAARTAVPVGVVRDGQRRMLTLVVDRRPGDTSATAGAAGAAVGLVMVDLTPTLAGRLGLPPETEGVVVEGLDAGGRAQRAGMRVGDVILEVNHRPVRSAEEVELALRSAADEALLIVSRGGRQVLMTMRRS